MHTRKKVDPRTIGIFVIGAIVLIVGGLLFFGPGGLFTETSRYVIYFESSVKGLNVGSPVRFRGVRIGQVKDISIRVNPSDLEFHIPVVIELDPKKIKADGSDLGLFETLKTSVQAEDPILPLIAEGLRAQLQLDSLVTGQLFVNLDMVPASPVFRVDVPSDYPQIPAISSSLAELTKTFEELPWQQLVDKLMQSADGVQRLFSSSHLHNAVEQFDTTTALLNELLTEMNTKIPALLGSAETTLAGIDTNIEATFSDIQQTLESARLTLDAIEQRVDPLATAFDRGMDAFTEASDKVTVAMDQFESLTADDSPLLQQFSITMQELNRTLRSLRTLADEIERNPQILLRGRAVEE